MSDGNIDLGLKALNLLALKSRLLIPKFIVINPELLSSVIKNIKIPESLSHDKPEEIQNSSEEIIEQISEIPFLSRILILSSTFTFSSDILLPLSIIIII
ncbi:hypothetical protein ES708_29834 [subsurface metagenome]